MLHQRHSGTHLCRDHFLASFVRRAKLEVAKQGRLPEGTLAVALSGGKDSVAALHFLHAVTRQHPRIRLVAVTVDEGIQGYRDAALAICRKVTGSLGIEWRLVRVRDLAGYSIDEYASGTRAPRGETPLGQARPACGPCGVFRREGMNRLARDAGASAIVTGHNLDDMAQTILMNHLKGDVARLARLAPHDEPQDGLVPRLMPFRTIPEKEVLLYAVLHGLPVHQEERDEDGKEDGAEEGKGGSSAECPYASRSHRFALRDVLVQLETTTPGTRHALVRGQERLKPILRQALPMPPLNACEKCQEPTSGAVCVACTLRA